MNRRAWLLLGLIVALPESVLSQDRASATLVGVLPASEAMALTRPSLATDGQTLLVVDSRNREAWIVDLQTGSVEMLGGRGQGPGEYLHPQSAGWYQDSLWVTDIQQRRVNLYSPDGDGSRTLTVGGIHLFDQPVSPKAPRAHGGVIAETLRMTINLIDGGLPTFVGWADASGEVLSSIRLETLDADLVASSADGAAFHSSQPFGRRDEFAVSPDAKAVWVVRDVAEVMTVEQYDANGDLRATHRISYEAPILEPKDIEAWLSGVRESLGEFAPRFERSLNDELLRPSRWPRARQVVADYFNAVWIEHPGPETSQWRRVCADGSALVVDLPIEVDSIAVAGRVMFAVRTGDYDVPEIVQLSLPGWVRACEPG